MSSDKASGAIERILIVCPTWVGDLVMCTPTLRALRNHYPEAHITALVKKPFRPVLDGCPFVDRIVSINSGRRPKTPAGKGHKRAGMFRLARRLAAARFDMAILLPNSFRSALLTRLAGIPRRVGYDRDGRGFLLTDRLIPRKEEGRFVPVPTLAYYMGIARYLGAEESDTGMALFTREEDDLRADALLRQAGHDPTGDQPLVLMIPGANFGAAKLWFPDRFAQVADRCVSEWGATVAVAGAPKERPILNAVTEAAQSPIINLQSLGVDLTLLKSVIKRSHLMITNDTGPRHMAAALSVPVVSIFGPTNPRWTTIDFADERQVYVNVYCSPCQKKTCPLRNTPDELICMKSVTPDMVFDAAGSLLKRSGAAS